MSRYLDIFRAEYASAKRANHANGATALAEDVGAAGTFGVFGNGTGKPEAGPVQDTAEAWSAWIAERTATRSAGYGKAAKCLAFEEAVCAWHARHARPNADLCAGCALPLDGECLRLADGAAVHLGSRDLDCLIAYGRCWRGAAASALAALGVEAPPGWSAQPDLSGQEEGQT